MRAGLRRGTVRVWVTRAEPGASATAVRLRERGHAPLVAPLVGTRPLPAAAPDLEGVAALAFTSAAGVRAFAALVGDRGLPVFAVGRATARAAHEAGWREVRDADGDGEALAAAVAAVPPSGVVLAPGAERRAFDLSAALGPAGVRVRLLPVYRTDAVGLSPGALAALSAGALEAVLLHSPSAARALDHALPGGPPATPGPWLLALAEACRPATPGWRTAVAPAPRERDLLALLDALDAAGRPG